MRLRGLHHITMITADAPRNVAFCAGALGLRMVKKTVNFDQPDAYHLYFGDEHGTPGSILTWFEFPGAAPGRAGAGMIHLLELAVPATASLDFWAERLDGGGAGEIRRDGDRLLFSDPDGLAYALVPAGDDPPLRAEHPDVPAEQAIVGLAGARAFTPRDTLEQPAAILTDTLGFTAGGPGEFRLDGVDRSFRWAYDPAPAARGLQGSGSVHHIAWACADEDQLAWQDHVRAAGRQVTPVLDRDYFRSIYFREPRGVLCEIATLSPGFAVDEDPGHLGEALRLPQQHEHLRGRLDQILTPLGNPRAAAGA